MAAILGADDAEVPTACAEAAQGEVVEPVNFNAPGQIVIAGHREAVERAIVRCEGARRQARDAAAGVRAVPLLAAEPAAERLAARLAQAPSRARRSPCCTTSTSRHREPDAIRAALARQAANPVRWTRNDPVRWRRAASPHVVECGPGKVLAGLVSGSTQADRVCADRRRALDAALAELARRNQRGTA